MDGRWIIELDRKEKKYLYQQLAEAIRREIDTRSLEEGEPLPSIKRLAKELKINPATVVKAYEVLEKEGYIEKKLGSGSFVKDRETQILNFASGTPSYDFFPVEDFKKIINDVMDNDGARAFEYTEGQGDRALRVALKNYIQKYNIHTNEDHIHVISGAQQGIDIIVKALVDQGEKVMIEKPSYTGAIGAFRSRGASLIEVPIKNDGLDLKYLESILVEEVPKLLYVMPNFQNPTGTSYSTYQKHRLLELSEKYGFYILEDDYLSDLSFYSKDSRTLKSLDRHHKVIYIKSFSKIFMPGLRLGFLVVPEELQEAILEAKLISDISTSGLLQRALKEYMERGMWERHIERLKTMYSRRFDLALDLIRREFPEEVVFKAPKGGLNFWFQLPKTFDFTKFVKDLEEQGIRIARGEYFFLTPPEEPSFRFSIANVDEEGIRWGILFMAELLRKAFRRKGRIEDREKQDLIL